MSKLSQSEYPTNILEENPFRDSKPRGGEPEGSDIIKYWIKYNRRLSTVELSEEKRSKNVTSMGNVSTLVYIDGQHIPAPYDTLCVVFTNNITPFKNDPDISSIVEAPPIDELFLDIEDPYYSDPTAGGAPEYNNDGGWGNQLVVGEYYYNQYDLSNDVITDKMASMGVTPYENPNYQAAIDTYGFGSSSPLIGIRDTYIAAHDNYVGDIFWLTHPDYCMITQGGECYTNNDYILPGHPDLQGKVQHINYECTPDVTDACDLEYISALGITYMSHGTSCASIMVSHANDGGGMVGICPNCNLSIWDLYAGLDWQAQGVGNTSPGEAQTERLFQHITTALEQGVRAVNGSYGSSSWGYNQDVQDAFQFAWNNDLIMVFAAGNNGWDHNGGNNSGNPWFSNYCDYDYVICVTTQDSQYDWDSSCTGYPGPCDYIDVATPLGSVGGCPRYASISGVGQLMYDQDPIFCFNEQHDINGADIDESHIFMHEDGSITSIPDTEYWNGSLPQGIDDNLNNWYKAFSGTSSAAPILTGMIGLLLSHNPSLTSDQIYEIITSTNIHPSSTINNEGYHKAYTENIDIDDLPDEYSISKPGTIDFKAALDYLYEYYMSEVVLGCTDPGASNYNPNATLDNGSCEYPPFDSPFNDPFYIDEFTGYQDGIYYNQSFLRDIGHGDAINTFGNGNYGPIIGVMDGGIVGGEEITTPIPIAGSCSDDSYQSCEYEMVTLPPHPDLEGKVIYYSEPSTWGFGETSFSHGTAVASIITTNTNNGTGMAGGCPNCRLAYFSPAKVISTPDGQIQLGGGILETIEGALDLGIRVINISMYLTGYADSTEEGHPNPIVQEAINEAFEQGVLIITVAGNYNMDLNTENPELQLFAQNLIPCYYDNLMCVTISGNSIPGGSSHAYDSSCSEGTGPCNYIDVSAPEGIIGACSPSVEPSGFNTGYELGDDCNSSGQFFETPSAGFTEFGEATNVDELWWGLGGEAYYKKLSATSSATPVVSSLAGLLLSHNPNLTSQNLYDIITNTNVNSSTSVNDGVIVGKPGTIDFFEAMQYMYDNYMSDDYVTGDYNTDSQVDISDIIILINFIINILNNGYTATPAEIELYDLNDDGILNVIDIVTLVGIILNTFAGGGRINNSKETKDGLRKLIEPLKKLVDDDSSTNKEKKKLDKQLDTIKELTKIKETLKKSRLKNKIKYKKDIKQHSSGIYYVKYYKRLSIKELEQEKSKHNLIAIKHAITKIDLLPSMANIVIVKTNNISSLQQDDFVLSIETTPDSKIPEEETTEPPVREKPLGETESRVTCSSDEVELWGECYNIEETTSISLPSSGLTGDIPLEIGDLINLEYLNLWANQLTGEIPPEIGNLTNLTYLRLQDNQLTGEIPSWIGNLTNLTVLRLQYNQLTGSIPVEIGNLINLEDLWLNARETGNQLTGEIPSSIGNLTNLTTLGLSSNQLTGEIPPEIGNLTNLFRLWLFDNQLTGEIPSELCNVNYLYVENNQLCPPYPECISQDDIDSQDTSECEELFCDEETEVQLWGVCYNIDETTELDLRYSGLTGEIPSEIGNLTNLTYLSLGLNQLTGGIPPEIGNLTNLEYLYLYNNQLTGEIPEEIGNLTNLTKFSLGGNQLTGEIPLEIGNLTNLTYLDLSSNQLTGVIPSWIGNLENLTSLFLNSNQLTGEIPAEIGNLTNLYKLYLYSNQLTGEIPSWIGDLENLRYLYLNSNQLGGVIPSEICLPFVGTDNFPRLQNNNLCPPYPDSSNNSPGGLYCTNLTIYVPGGEDYNNLYPQNECIPIVTTTACDPINNIWDDCDAVCGHEGWTKGDINSNSIINVEDLVEQVAYILSEDDNIIDNPCMLWAADYNGDGIINVVDIVAIVNIIMGSTVEECPGASFTDCFGTCGGSAVLDCAGVCNGDSYIDCAGTCGGTSLEDCAGICNGDNVVDCSGICGGLDVDVMGLCLTPCTEIREDGVFEACPGSNACTTVEQAQASMGNGECAQAFDCALFDYDGGDCVCPTGEIYDCAGVCVPDNLIDENGRSVDGVCYDGHVEYVDTTGMTTWPNFMCDTFSYNGGLCFCSVCDCTDRDTDNPIIIDDIPHYVCNEGHHHCIQDEYGYGHCINPRHWYMKLGNTCAHARYEYLGELEDTRDAPALVTRCSDRDTWGEWSKCDSDNDGFCDGIGDFIGAGMGEYVGEEVYDYFATWLNPEYAVDLDYGCFRCNPYGLPGWPVPKGIYFDEEPKCNRRCAWCDDGSGNIMSDTGENENICSGTWIDECHSGIAYRTKYEIEEFSRIMFQEDEPTNPARYFLEQHITNDARRAYERGVQPWVMFGPTADTMNADFPSAQSILTAVEHCNIGRDFNTPDASPYGLFDYHVAEHTPGSLPGGQLESTLRFNMTCPRLTIDTKTHLQGYDNWVGDGWNGNYYSTGQGSVYSGEILRTHWFQIAYDFNDCCYICENYCASTTTGMVECNESQIESFILMVGNDPDGMYSSWSGADFTNYCSSFLSQNMFCGDPLQKCSTHDDCGVGTPRYCNSSEICNPCYYGECDWATIDGNCPCGGTDDGTDDGDDGGDDGVDEGCGTDEWDCGDGQCIPASYYCDGSDEFGNATWPADCSNGADEIIDMCCIAGASAYVFSGLCDDDVDDLITSCISHSQCDTGYYCDDWANCEPCSEFWTNYCDTYDGTCPTNNCLDTNDYCYCGAPFPFGGPEDGVNCSDLSVCGGNITQDECPDNNVQGHSCEYWQEGNFDGNGPGGCYTVAQIVSLGYTCDCELCDCDICVWDDDDDFDDPDDIDDYTYCPNGCNSDYIYTGNCYCDNYGCANECWETGEFCNWDSDCTGDDGWDTCDEICSCNECE